jgi:hypothetical protein
MGGMTRKKLVQYIGVSLTPWWLAFPYVGSYLPQVIFLAAFLTLVALAIFGLGLVWWAERRWAA